MDNAPSHPEVDFLNAVHTDFPVMFFFPKYDSANTAYKSRDNLQNEVHL